MSEVFDGLAALFGDNFREETVQERRRDDMLDSMLNIANAAKVAANLVNDIVEEHEDRMQIDDEDHLIIVGRLAIYRVDVKSFMGKFVNPFSYNSFDVVEVHPKSGLVKEPKTACVQVLHQENMPAYDLFAGYLLGLLNDEVSWLHESLSPLRRTLFHIYGLARSPLSPSMEQHFANTVSGGFDFTNDTFTFEGTNGWSWRIHYGLPLNKGYRIEYQKPRQTWWNLLFDDHDKETTGHYVMCGFFEIVEHLNEAPGGLKGANDWQPDPLLLRKIAADYPPLAKSLVDKITSPDYDAEEIYTDFEEPIEGEKADIIKSLDLQVLETAGIALAHA